MRSLVLACVLSLPAVVVAAAPSIETGAADTVVVDAREASRGVLRSHLSLAVHPGAITLLYPKWLPGRHSPAGPITSLAGPVIAANGQPLGFRRDAVEPYAFEVVVPRGVTRLEIDLEVLTAIAPDGVVQGLESPRYATESLAIVEWNQALLYVAGTPTDALRYAASVQLPVGWSYATALETATQSAGGAVFATTSLTTLVDSTLIAGRYLHRYPLGGTPAVELDVLADRATSSVPTEGLLQHYRDLVSEATVLFGATHYRNYRFLWTLSDQIMEDGIEHHESSDDRSPLRSLQDDDLRRVQASLLPHEYVHSWNGKFRRPVGLATPDYQTPMKGELLWVYEGLTEYLGNVLAVRSGLLTVDEFRDELARLAAQMDLHHGRDWRSLEDSVAAAPLLYYQDKNWAARLRRQDDFYQESALLWLEADTLIRRLSGGVRSLDEFCAHFYGGVSGVAKVIPYDFDGLVTALNDVQPYDWRKFWRERLTRLGGGAPMTGLESAGWSLAYSAVPSSMHVAHEHDDHALNLQYSLGFQIAEEGGTISDIVPGSPADLAKMAPGSHLIAVNGHRYNAATMADTLADTAASTVEVLVEKDDEYVRYELRYNGGMRYPNLQANGDADLLRRIAAPRRGP